MSNQKLEMFIDYFKDQGIKFVDIETGEEIEPSGAPTTTCKICGNETPEGKTCMWCQNKLGEK